MIYNRATIFRLFLSNDLKHNNCFQVVFVFFDDGLGDTNVEYFLHYFLKKLKPLLNLPSTRHHTCEISLGFTEPCGAVVLSKLGVSAYPFTHKNLVNMETENTMDLKLEML